MKKSLGSGLQRANLVRGKLFGLMNFVVEHKHLSDLKFELNCFYVPCSLSNKQHSSLCLTPKHIVRVLEAYETSFL